MGTTKENIHYLKKHCSTIDVTQFKNHQNIGWAITCLLCKKCMREVLNLDALVQKVENGTNIEHDASLCNYYQLKKYMWDAGFDIYRGKTTYVIRIILSQTYSAIVFGKQQRYKIDFIDNLTHREVLQLVK